MIATVVLCAVLSRPAGLYVSGGNWFYFPSSPAGDTWTGQTTFDRRFVRFSNPKANVSGGIYGTWAANDVVRPLNSRSKGSGRFASGRGKTASPSRPDADAKGTTLGTDGEDGYFLEFTNSTKSAKFGGLMILITDQTPDFFSGDWTGGDLTASLEQNGQEVTGRCKIGGHEFGVVGTRNGAFCQAWVVTLDRNEQVGTMSLMYDPTAADINVMRTERSFRGSRLMMMTLDGNRIEKTELVRTP